MLLNAFPLQIVPDGSVLEVRAASLGEAREAVANGSAVGHTDTAALLASILGVAVPVARVTLPALAAGDHVVAQYSGPRLPEGATSLPAGARIEFRRVTWCPAT